MKYSVKASTKGVGAGAGGGSKIPKKWAAPLVTCIKKNQRDCTIPRAPQHLNIGYVHKQYQQAYNLDFESIFFLEVNNNNDALVSLSLPSYRNR